MKKLILPLIIVALLLSCEKEVSSCYTFIKRQEVILIYDGDTIPHDPYYPKTEMECGLYPDEVETYCKIFSGRDTLIYNETVFVSGCYYDHMIAYVDYTCEVLE